MLPHAKTGPVMMSPFTNLKFYDFKASGTSPQILPSSNATQDDAPEPYKEVPDLYISPTRQWTDQILAQLESRTLASMDAQALAMELTVLLGIIDDIYCRKQVYSTLVLWRRAAWIAA